MTRFAGLARFLAIFVCGLVSAPALACSCWGTTGIGTALTEAEIVVVGQVERRLDSSEEERPDFSRNGAIEPAYPNPIVVRVVRTLKGDVGDEIRISTDFMCYRSFDVEDMKPGETFVFPVSRTTESGLGLLPSCSHSALKLVDGELYTNELTAAGGRRLAHYMSLTMMRLLLPLGLLDTAVQIVLAAAVLLLAPVLITWRVRRRTASAGMAELPQGPAASLRSVNLRTAFAIGWLLLCAGICTFKGFSEGDPGSLVIGVSLGAAFAYAAAGAALQWRWTEGLVYGLALMCVVGSLALVYMVVAQYFEHRAQFEYVPTRQLVIFSLAVLSVIAIMIWCAGAVRRRFSSKAS